MGTSSTTQGLEQPETWQQVSQRVFHRQLDLGLISRLDKSIPPKPHLSAYGSENVFAFSE